MRSIHRSPPNAPHVASQPSAHRKHVAAALALGALGIFVCLTIGFVCYVAGRRDRPPLDNGPHAERTEPADHHADKELLPVEPPPPDKPQGTPRQDDDANRPRLSPQRQATVDAAIQRGVDFLKHTQLESSTWSEDYHPAGLAALPALTWSLGRVGLLYRARKIGGKDWYAWGVNQVLAWQEANGSWKANVYPNANAAPIINTCFALLFLQRSHLTEDVSKTLEFKLESKQLHENRQ